MRDTVDWRRVHNNGKLYFSYYSPIFFSTDELKGVGADGSHDFGKG
jgi:hypothetical protein